MNEFAQLDAEFADIAYDWAELTRHDFSIDRDEYEGWYWRIGLSDALGPFSATGRIFSRTKARKGRPTETHDEFKDRIIGKLKAGLVDARKLRTKRLNNMPTPKSSEELDAIVSEARARAA